MKRFSIVLGLLLTVYGIGSSEESSSGASSWQRLGGILDTAEEDPELAKTELQALLIDQPQFLAARYNLGLLSMDSDPSLAATELTAATRSTNPELRARSAYNLALVHHQAGRHEAAVAAASTAAQAQPENSDYKSAEIALRKHLLRIQEALRLEREAKAKELRLDPSPLPAGRVGKPYTGRIQARGGAGEPYLFVAAASDDESKPSLPPGLRLRSDGTLSGTPENSGEQPLRITVQDSAETTAIGEQSIRIKPSLAISPKTLPPAVLGQPYSVSIQAIGADRPQWQIESLPPGISAEAGQQLTLQGQPDQAGLFTMPLTLRDNDGAELQQEITLFIDDAFTVAETELTPATAWRPYSDRLTVRGPEQRYTWQAEVVNGLQVDSDGTVTGRPDEAGIFALTVVVKAETGTQRQASVSIVVNPPPTLVLPETIELHQGRMAQESLTLNGGTAPFEWSVEKGNLPPGVGLEAGTLQGVPTEMGEWEVAITATDRWQANATATTTINVSEFPPDTDDQENEENQDGEQEQDSEQNQDGEQNQTGDDNQNSEQDQNGQNNEQDGEQNQDGNSPQPNEPNQPQQGSGEQQRNQEQGQRLSEADAKRWLDQTLANEGNQDDRALRSLLEGMSEDNESGQGIPGGNPW